MSATSNLPNNAPGTDSTGTLAPAIAYPAAGEVPTTDGAGNLPLRTGGGGFKHSLIANGAAGQAGVDDTAIITAVIEAAAAAYIATGIPAEITWDEGHTFSCSQIPLASGVTWSCYGAEIQMNMNSWENHGWCSWSTSDAPPQLAQWGILGGKFVGTGTEQGAFNQYWLQVGYGASNFTLRDIEVTGLGWVAALIVNPSNYLIENCRFHGNELLNNTLFQNMVSLQQTEKQITAAALTAASGSTYVSAISPKLPTGKYAIPSGTANFAAKTVLTVNQGGGTGTLNNATTGAVAAQNVNVYYWATAGRIINNYFSNCTADAVGIVVAPNGVGCAGGPMHLLIDGNICEADPPRLDINGVTATTVSSNGTTTIQDSNATQADLNKYVTGGAGANIPPVTYVTNVNPGVSLTLNNAVPAGLTSVAVGVYRNTIIVEVDDNTFIPITDVTMTNNNITGYERAIIGITLQNNGACNGCRIEGNTVSNLQTVGANTGTGNGVNLSGTNCTYDVDVVNNTINAPNPIKYGSGSTNNGRQRDNSYTTGPKQGTIALTGTTPVAVNTTEIQAGDTIIFNRQAATGTPGQISIGTITAGTSFTLVSTTAETSTVFWEIVH